MRLPTVLFFVVMTFLCWGSYGPTLHEGQVAMGHSRWRPFICVGLAYFLIAVVVPWMLLRLRSEDGRWTVAGVWWSLLAGTVGAIGALGIILAFQFGGTPVFIMPLVFGCAPVVNTFVTMLMNQTHREASVLFYIAVALVALGAAGVLVFKPGVTDTAAAEERAESPHNTPPAEPGGDAGEAALLRQEVQQLKQKQAESDQEIKGIRKLLEESSAPEPSPPSDVPAETTNDLPDRSQPEVPPQAELDPPADVRGDLSFRADISGEETETTESAESTEEPDHGFLDAIKCFLAILLTAICWGAYGPTLHKGQSKMDGSRLRPFICVGLAYFLIAVIVPTLVLWGADDGAKFTIVGTFWSLVAGAVGAIGALGIIMAFNFGGRPVFVMPLVFGGAPVVNTIISMAQSYYKTGQSGAISSLFLLSLVLVIIGAVCVLLFAPRPHAKQSQPVNED